MKELYFVSTELTPEGINSKVESSKIIKETDKQLNTETKIGGKSLIYKKDMNIVYCPYGQYYNSSSRIAFGAHCEEKNVQVFTDKCLEAVKKYATDMKRSVDGMVSHI